ncbi:MAG: PAS domain-containing protein, partial [Bacteroidales bacterium]
MNKSAWLITLIYFTLSFLWIIFSDKILLSFESDPVILSKIQTYKGWIFVLLSSVLIYLLTSKSTKKLKEKEKQLSKLIGNLKGIAYRFKNDANWTMTFLSKGIQKVTGYNPEDLINNKNLAYADLILPEDRKKVFDEIQQALKIYKQFKITYRIKAKSNDEKWLWEQGVGVYNENGQLRWIEGYIDDINEQKLAEIALQKSEQKYKNLVENSLVGIYTSNIDGELIFTNILKSNFKEHIDTRSNEFFQIIFNASSRLKRTIDMM